MAQPSKITMEKFKKALSESFGIMTQVAKRLGVSRTALYTFINDNEKEAKPLIEEEKEKMLDFSESKLLSLIGKEDFRAISLLLKTQGKSRGYVERVENVNTNVEPVILELPEQKFDTDE